MGSFKAKRDCYYPHFSNSMFMSIYWAFIVFQALIWLYSCKEVWHRAYFLMWNIQYVSKPVGKPDDSDSTKFHKDSKMRKCQWESPRDRQQALLRHDIWAEAEGWKSSYLQKATGRWLVSLVGSQCFRGWEISHSDPTQCSSMLLTTALLVSLPPTGMLL